MSTKSAPASAPTTAKTTKISTVDVAELDTLARWLEKSALEEVEIESAGTRIRLRKPSVGGAVAMVAAPAASAVPASAPTAPAEAGSPFTSPMVGTYYQAANPEAAPFVKVGDTVKEGQPLCIIEAMKTMNQITADRAGTITKVLLKNGQPVEFGQPLFIIA